MTKCSIELDQKVPWMRWFWISSLLLKFNMSIRVQTQFQGFIQDQKNNCFRWNFLVAASKHEENCPITFIPSNFSCHICSRSNSARKSIIGKINCFTRRPECKSDFNKSCKNFIRHFLCPIWSHFMQNVNFMIVRKSSFEIVLA